VLEKKLLIASCSDGKIFLEWIIGIPAFFMCSSGLIEAAPGYPNFKHGE